MKGRPISISPNATARDIGISFRLLFSPWRWRRGNASAIFGSALQKLVGAQEVWLFNSGRSALLTLLRALDIGLGDEVVVQAFTCVAVPDPILWVGAKPVFADVRKGTFNMGPKELEKCISKRTKAVILQHTFGQPAPLKEIMALAAKHKFIVIEDCAHAIGGTYEGKPLGSFGDAAFFSFGRDKMISSVYGGALVSNKKSVSEAISREYSRVRSPSRAWIFQQLLHPIVMALLLPWYRFRITSVFLWVLQRIGIMSKAIQPCEYTGQRPYFFPQRYANALAVMGLSQLQRLGKFNAHRREIARIYYEKLKRTDFTPPDPGEIAWLRYPIFTQSSRQFLHRARQNGFYLGDWYLSPVAPLKTNLAKVGYRTGSCPEAEKLSLRIVNLPTHIHYSKRQALALVDWLLSYDKLQG